MSKVTETLSLSASHSQLRRAVPGNSHDKVARPKKNNIKDQHYDSYTYTLHYTILYTIHYTGKWTLHTTDAK